MKFDAIHLKHEEASTIDYIVPLIIISILLIVSISSIVVPILYHDKMIISTTIVIICIIVLSLTTIMCIYYWIKERKNGDIYGFYIGADDERIKRITKEEYYFIQSIKDDYILGVKIKEEDINKVRDIIKR